MNTPSLTPGIPPNEVRLIRKKIWNNILDGAFNPIMFTPGSVDFIQHDNEYAALSRIAEQVLNTYSCSHVFVDVTGINPETQQFKWTLYLYSDVRWAIQQIQYSGEVSISWVPEKLKASQNGAITVLDYDRI